LGYVSAVDFEERTMFVADAHRHDGKRFVVHADEKLAAFLELEREICLRLLTVPISAILTRQHRVLVRVLTIT
jgi:hypothetical protein